jgi:hypothetical protein
MDTKQILKDFDKHASEFNFPVLDNAYMEFASARLSAFQGASDWLVVFEILGFSTREIEFVDDLYVFGSCVEKEGFAAEEIPVSGSPAHRIFNPETNACLADWSHWSILVKGKEVFFSPTREEYAEAGIVIERDPGPGTLSEIELLRFLIHRLGKDRIFMSEKDLLSHFSKCKDLTKFVRADQWEHPDLANAEKPSNNIVIRSLVEALAQRNPSLFDQGLPNTHWTFWN